MRRSYTDSFARAEEMRSLSGKYSSAEIAKMFDVSSGYVRAVLAYKKCVRTALPDGNYKNIKVGDVRFAIYDDGRVWSYSLSKLLKFNYSKGDYARFSVKTPEKRVRLKVHRLVLSLFDRRPKKGEIGRHLDDDRTNNHISNLAWGYHEDNVSDAKRNESYAVGSAIACAKLTEALAKELVDTYDDSITMIEHCKQFNEKHGLEMRVQHLRSIMQGKFWSHATGVTEYQKKFVVKLDDKAVRYIHRRWIKLQKTMNQHDAARRVADFLNTKGYDVAWRTVKKVMRGGSFKHIYNEFY